MNKLLKKIFTITALIFTMGILIPSVNATTYVENSPLYKKCQYEKTQQDGIKCAEKEYNKLVKKNPKDEILYGEMIFIYRQAKQYNNAINICNAGIKAIPNSYILYNLLGTSQKDIGNMDAAIAAFTKSIEIEPTEPPYYNRARLYVAKEEYDKAISDYSMAIKYSATNPDAYKERAMTKIWKSGYDKNLTDDEYRELFKSASNDFDMALKQYRETNNAKGYQEVLDFIEKLNSIRNKINN